MYTMNWGRLPTWGVKWERRFCSPIKGMADKEKLQPASCLTDGHCRHAQDLKKNWKVPTWKIQVCSDAWRKHKRQHVCWRKRWNIFFIFFFSIFSQLCSLEPAINFRKIKHPNKTSLKLWNLRSFLCLHQRLNKTFSQAVGLMARTPQPLLQTLDGWMVGQDKEEWVSPRPL